MPPSSRKPRVALLHGAGYVGGELIRLLDAHPGVELATVTSSTFAGDPVGAAHPALRGTMDRTFAADADLSGLDALVTAAGHGQSAHELPALLEGGFDGAVVDLSADFRHGDPALYERWYDYTHPAPALLGTFAYGLPEARAPYDTRRVANPGCFATGLALALWPLAATWPAGAPFRPAITALTGASGSGAQPSAATHFPTRDGNVRAYKVLAHQHQPEVHSVLSGALERSPELAFAPVSGPWTRGIWGTAHLRLPDGYGDAAALADAFARAYGDAPLVRCSPGTLPELRHAARTPFCDVGWQVEGQQAVVGFALDNLLKGAASQAVQNLNLLLGLPETTGLLPRAAPGGDAPQAAAPRPAASVSA